jgi:hypothetical protein
MRLVLADMGHLWEHQRLKNRHLPAREYSLRVGEVLRGRVFAALDDAGQPLALGGIFDAGDGGPGYPWLSVVPGGLGSQLIPAVRHMRRVIGWAAGDFPSGLACSVDDGNVNGQRLARALGFVPGAVDVHGLRYWDHADHGGHDLRTHATPADADDARRASRAAAAAG